MNRSHHTGLFLMEMITVVLFFILCAAICIQTFVKADFMSRRAMDLNHGVFIAQSIAEVWKAEDIDGLQKKFQAKKAEGETDRYLMGFDKSGSPCKSGKAVYYARAEISAPRQVTVVISRGKTMVYTLCVSRHDS